MMILLLVAKVLNMCISILKFPLIYQGGTESYFFYLALLAMQNYRRAFQNTVSAMERFIVREMRMNGKDWSFAPARLEEDSTTYSQ